MEKKIKIFSKFLQLFSLFFKNVRKSYQSLGWKEAAYDGEISKV